jgi:hypothetical protein
MIDDNEAKLGQMCTVELDADAVKGTNSQIGILMSLLKWRKMTPQ